MTGAASRSRRAVRWVGGFLVVVGVAAVPLAVVADAVFGVDVTVLHRLYEPEEREAWRRDVYDPRDDAAEIYGLPESPGSVRVLVFDRDRLITPREAPERRLLHVDRRAGETVWERRTLWVGALATAAAALAFGWLLLRAVRPLPSAPKA